MKDLKLWGIFISLIIVVQALGFFVFSGIAWCLFHAGILSPDHPPMGWFPFLTNTCSSALISLCITTAISHHFFRPIQDLVHALEQVSAGNFDVRLKENDIWYEVREMNLNFNKMVKELNSIETLQSDFIQNVSHEIKTPLAAIEGYAALLSASTRDEQNKLYAEQILKSSRQLSTLTGNILKLSKLENQSIISEKKTFSLDEQIRQAVLSLEPIWSAKNIDIDLNLPEISFYGNEDLIFQIWTNLISNGIKFTPSGGLVSVKMTAEDSFVNVVVADNGIGMTEEVQILNSGQHLLRYERREMLPGRFRFPSLPLNWHNCHHPEISKQTCVPALHF